MFCVEERLTAAHRPHCAGSSASTGTLYPALTFTPLVDKVDLFKTKKLPVEFLSDNKLLFQEYSQLKTITVSFSLLVTRDVQGNSQSFHWQSLLSANFALRTLPCTQLCSTIQIDFLFLLTSFPNHSARMNVIKAGLHFPPAVECNWWAELYGLQTQYPSVGLTGMKVLNQTHSVGPSLPHNWNRSFVYKTFNRSPNFFYVNGLQCKKQ